MPVVAFPLCVLFRKYHGLDLTSKRFDKRAIMFGVKLYHGGPCVKHSDDAFIDAFTGRFRQECRNENRFLPLEDAEVKAEAWRRH